MPYSVKSVDISRARDVAKAMIAARWADPHWRILYEEGTSIDKVTDETGQRLPWNLINGRAAKRHEMSVDDSTGEVVGYVRWLLPAHLAAAEPAVWLAARIAEPTPEERTKYEKDFKDATNDGQIRGLRNDLMQYRSTPLEEMDARINEGGPFLFLDYLSTAPQHQRRGVGAMLLRHGLEVADANHLRAYVTASPAGVKLYQNHGFEIVETVSIDYSQFGGTEPVRDYFMIRKPQRPS